MKRIFGILGLLVFVCALTALRSENFLSAYNIDNIARRTSLYGLLGIGVAFVIVTGGIDLSIGSLVGLAGSALPWLLVQHDWPVLPALAVVVLVSTALGVFHGLLITKLRLQPFVVTLCGLLFYRGMARYLTDDQSQGFGGEYSGLKYLVTGVPASLPVPGIEGGIALSMPVLILAATAILAGTFLTQTVWGRYILALGRNEEAARYSGIDTDRMVIVSYAICSTLAGVGGILFALDLNSVQPGNLGNFFELYAIAAAVLGGCSLRGGEGSILGVVIGAALLQVLYNSINILGIPTQLEPAIIGAVILAGVIADEVIRRLARRRK